jgi:hypothetical protein
MFAAWPRSIGSGRESLFCGFALYLEEMVGDSGLRVAKKVCRKCFEMNLGIVRDCREIAAGPRVARLSGAGLLPATEASNSLRLLRFRRAAVVVNSEQLPVVPGQRENNYEEIFERVCSSPCVSHG